MEGRPVAYVDETGIDTWVQRDYGWSERGVPLVGRVPGRKYERTGVVAALCGGEIVAPCQYEDTMDSALFEKWFAQELLPALPERSVIVMDNAAFHRKAMLRRLAEGTGHSLLFLPPYSPELNPIEHFWGWLKRYLEKILPLHSTFDEALCSAFQVR